MGSTTNTPENTTTDPIRAPAAGSGGVRGGLRKLAGASAVYGLGSVLVRGLTFVLLPVYTRYLDPAQYGIVSLTLTCTAVLGMLFPLGLRAAVSRSYFEGGSEGVQRERIGTIWTAMILFAAAFALVLDRAGPALAAVALPEVPFHPYLRFAVWTAFLGVLGLTPLALLQAEERARAYVALSLWTALSTTAVTLWLVLRGGGARGYLLGVLLGAALAAMPYLTMTLRRVRPALRMEVLRAALAFSLPLVPHMLAGWVLEMSDRAILTRFLPLGEVGIYTLGYQLGAAVGLLTTAFNAAWVPFLFATLKSEAEGGHRKLTRLATYYAVALVFVGLGWSLLVKYAVAFMVGPEFREAYRITPWVVGGYVFAGLYLIPTNLLFWQRQTRVIPLATLAAGVVNVGLNVTLVPRYGAIAAAWSTLAAYAVLLIVTWRSAERLHPFPYEYRRVGTAAGLALGLYLVGVVVPFPSLTAEAAARFLLWLGFPLALAAAGVFDRTELAALAGVVRRRLRLRGSQAGPRRKDS
ncbi:MAG TPA: oligosaccharide flippase family protein [Gemmatimonadales bacterium]